MDLFWIIKKRDEWPLCQLFSVSSLTKVLWMKIGRKYRNNLKEIPAFVNDIVIWCVHTFLWYDGRRNPHIILLFEEYIICG